MPKWIGLLVILLLLVFLIVPATSLPHEVNQKSYMVNGSRMISGMLLKHRMDTGQDWPNPWQEVGVNFPVIKSKAEARLVTSAMLEYLAYKQDMVLEHFLFELVKLREIAEDVSPRLPSEIISKPDLRWSQDLCIDWSNARGVSVDKPVLSTRTPIDGHIVVTYADGHSKLVEFSVGSVVADDDIFNAFDGGSFYQSYEDVKFADSNYKGIWMK